MNNEVTKILKELKSFNISFMSAYNQINEIDRNLILIKYERGQNEVLNLKELNADVAREKIKQSFKVRKTLSEDKKQSNKLNSLRYV